MNQDNFELLPVPLPTEIPEPPSLENLPTEILHSATVEMLIQQNEDLSSRLKINIRRNSQQEQQLLQIKKELQEIEQKNQVLISKNKLINEKQALWSEQKRAKDKKLDSHKSEIELLELRYNELYTTSKQKQKESHQQLISKNQELSKLQRKNNIQKRISSRAKDRLRTFLIDMVENLNKNSQARRKIESQNRILQKRFKELHNEITEKEQSFRDHLQDFTQKSQFSIEKFKQETQELKDALLCKENDAQSSKKDLQELRNKLDNEKENRHKISQLSLELTRLQNEKIELSKKAEIKTESLKESAFNTQGDLKLAKNEMTHLQKQLSENKQTLHACESRLVEITKDNKEMTSQLETIKTLWIEAQDKLEKEELKNQTLERINRELSQSSKVDKIERSLDRVHEKAPEEAHKNRLSDVYASQYMSIGKGPNLDV